MKISVIIPVVNEQLCCGLLNSIAQNTKLPHEILIVDNTSDGFFFPTNILHVDYYRSASPLGVNASWQLGFDNLIGCDAISVLNDDILLNKHFFERTERVLALDPKVAVSVPYTVDKVEELTDHPIDQHNVVGVGKREGWAFTIKTDILNQLPRFPHEKIRTFFGDDWIFLWSHQKSYGKWTWLKDLNNVVWHKGGTGVRKLNVRGDRAPERLIYKAAVNKVLEGRSCA